MFSKPPWSDSSMSRMINARCHSGCLFVSLTVPSRLSGRQRDGKSESGCSNTESLSHMLPHVRVSQARTGAALCKCLPESCGTAGDTHMFVLWSSY